MAPPPLPLPPPRGAEIYLAGLRSQVNTSVEFRCFTCVLWFSRSSGFAPIYDGVCWGEARGGEKKRRAEERKGENQLRRNPSHLHLYTTPTMSLALPLFTDLTKSSQDVLNGNVQGEGAFVSGAQIKAQTMTAGASGERT